MKNKILWISAFILLCSVCFADVYETEIYTGNIKIEDEIINNIIIIRNNPKPTEEEYNALENQVYTLLKNSNEECLKLLGLSKNQKEKVAKLQHSYLNCAKSHGVLLKKAYIEYNEEYKKDPSSKETSAKKEILKKHADNVKKDYDIYQKNLFDILNEKQINIYNKYLENKIQEMKTKWKNRNNK